VSTVPRGRPIRRAPYLAVDVLGSLNLIAALLKYLSLAVLVPAGVAVGYGEPVWPFLAAGAIVGGGAVVVERATGGGRRLGTREAFLVVSSTWLGAALLGALPYLLSGDPQLDRPIDAYFEAMSGFTTTGASVVTDLDALPRSLLLWRQFTQWLGGIGIIVLALAVLPRLRVGGRQLLEHEMPGPEIESLRTRIRDTARRVWLLYLALTAALIGILLAFDVTGVDERMTGFDAFAHALTTMPTGGFGTDGRSLEPFAPATQWAIVLFMILAGANFALLYRVLVRRQPVELGRDREFRLYASLLALGSVILAVEIWAEGIAGGEEAVRHAVFQTVSTMTTTGYATVDFVAWPTLAAMTLVGLMFVGGSAGSTSGSVKVVRHLLMGKILRREIDQTLHPEVVAPVRLGRTIVDERTLRAVSSFIVLYIGIFVVGAALLAAEAERSGVELGTLDAIAAAATTLGNVGPGFGFAGPFGSFEPFSDFSTIVLTCLMWVGRLEVLPIVVLLSRHYWRNA
jgi:trk system potassium uptake protein TrkH